MIVSGSGRCHGPGCTRSALLDFCSARCQSAWHASVAEPPQPLEQRTCHHCHRADCPEPLAAWEVELLAGSSVRLFCPPSPEDKSTPSGATYQQVAPEDPQVGWLAKWINRIRRGR